MNSPEFEKLDQIIDEYLDVQGNLIIILQKAQEIFGYLPRDVIRHISRRTGHTQAKIYGVATFYTQFRLQPIGEKAIVEELGICEGETTSDGIFTFTNVACLGCCSLAPVMMISGPDGEETYGNLTKESTKEILKGIMAAR